MVPMNTKNRKYDKYYYVRKIDKNRSMWNLLMNNWNIMFGVSLSYGKSRKIERWKIICSDECLKWFFLLVPSYIGNIIYLAKIVIALSSYMFFFDFFQKVNNSRATKLCVNLINTCTIFLKNGARHNSLTKLCSAFLNMKMNQKLVEKSNA